MLNGQYVGCTTGFSQSNKTDIFIPNQSVNDHITPYLQRLVAVDLIKVEQTLSPIIPSEPESPIYVDDNYDYIPTENLTGFRFRLAYSWMTKSESLHTYNPEAMGTNGEKVINLANLFDDLRVRGDGWTQWSRPLTFEDVNYPSSNGGVTLVFTQDNTPNYWMDMSGIVDLEGFFARLINTPPFLNSNIEYYNFG